MLPLLALRCLAIAATAGALYGLSPSVFQSLVILVGLTHYVLALAYSGRTVGRIVRRRIPAASLAGLLVLTAASTVLHWPPILLFSGLHHVLSEVYTVQGVHPETSETLGRPPFKLLRAGFHWLVFLMAARGSLALVFPSLPDLSETGWLITYVAIALVYAAVILCCPLPRRTKIDLFCAEGLVFAVALGLRGHGAGIMPLLAYHFAYWAAYPVAGLRAAGKGRLTRYVAGSVVATAVIYAAFLGICAIRQTPVLWTISTLGMTFMMATGYVHIGLSFGLSRDNPRFIRRRFATDEIQAIPTVQTLATPHQAQVS